MAEKKRILIVVGVLCGAFLLLAATLAGIVLYALGKALDNIPSQRREIVYKPDSFNKILDKAQKLRAVLAPSDAPAPAEETMIFNSDEVNALIYMAMNKEKMQSFLAPSKSNAPAPQPKDYDICFENGKFLFSCSKPTGLPAFLGKYMNIRAEMVPEISRDAENIRIDAMSIGSLNVPPQYLKSKVDELAGVLKKNPDYERMRKIVSELKVDKDGNLVLVYKTDELRKYVQDFLMKKMLQF